MAFTITAVGTSATATGTNGNDFGDFSAFTTLALEALEGDDLVTTTNPLTNSSISMDAGNDALFGEDFIASTIKLGEGIDNFDAFSLDNGTTAGGGKGADFMTATFVGDGSALKGGKGADDIRVFGNTNVSTVAGGKGADLISVSFNNQNSIVNGGNGDDQIFVGTNEDTGSSVFGGAGDDEITAFGIGIVNGDDGNDTIFAEGTVYGGAGDDTIALIDGVSTYFGGSGADTFELEAEPVFNGVVFDYEVGSDLIDLDTTGLRAQSGGSALVFQDSTAALALGLNTTVYEIAAGTANIGAFLEENVLGVGTSVANEITVINYEGGGALITNVTFNVTANVIDVLTVTDNAFLRGVGVGELSAADFV